MDLARFEEDLICALGRPEEWRVHGTGEFLIHERTGIRVCWNGETYPFGTMRAPYARICTVPQKTIEKCRAAVSKREAIVISKNSARARKAFLDSFPGFRK